MPTFGQYETAQRLFLSGVGGVYALQSDGRKVIKVLRPPPGIWSEERIQEEIDAFRLRAKIQKKIAQASRHWAPIQDVAAFRDAAVPGASTGGDALESAAGEPAGPRPVADGAYAVMDRYERSVQSLLDGRVNVNNADLRALFTGIIQGLLDLQKSAARPHGAIQASNILLANSADLTAATVHLTDPAPDGALTPAGGARDLADLARLLYHLVNRRPYDEGTIGRNREWDALGPNGEDWRKLCNAWLDPHAPAAERDLEKILPRIQAWTAKPQQSKAPFLLAAALVLLIAGGITAYFMLRTPPLQFDQLSWETESLTYYSWFGDFADQMHKPAVRDKFRKPPYPEIARLFDDAKDLDQYDPASIAHNAGLEWIDLISTPTDSVKKYPGPENTRKGLKLIAQVTAALTPARWPVLGKLDETAARYLALGWQKPAGGIRAVIVAAQAPVIPDQRALPIAERYKTVTDDKNSRKETIFQSVERTIAAAASVSEIDARWARIQSQLGNLHAGDVPLLRKLPDFAQALPHSQARPDDPGTLEDVTALAAAFAKIEDVLTRLNAALSTPGREVIFAELAKDPLAAADVAPSLEAYQALALAVPAYVKLTDDPRVKVNADWQARQPQVRSDMDDFFAKAAPKVNGVQAQLDDLTARVKALQNALAAAAQIVPIEKNRQALATAAGDAAALAEKIAQDAQAWSAPFKTDPVQYVKEKRAYLLASPLARATPAVYEQWKAAHAKLLAKVEATQDDLRKDYNYKLAVDDKFQRLEAVYAAIDSAIPVKVPALSDIGGTDWRHAIAARVATVYREDALKDLLSHLPAPSDDVPNLADAAFVSYQTQRLAAFEKSRADTLALLSDYAGLTDRLDHLDLLPNEPAPGSSWRDLFARWGGAPPAARNPLLADAAIAAGLQPITDRVAALLALDPVSDYKTLFAQAQSPVPEIALTAWRKLGAAPLTEDLPALDDEDKAEAALQARLTALADAQILDSARLRKITAEIAAQRPVRWQRWTDLAASGDTIAHAVAAAKSFGIDLTRQSQPVLFYYQELLKLRAAYQAAPTEDALKGPAADFIKTVTDPPLGDLPKNEAVAALIEAMKKSLSKEQDTSAASRQGPQFADWDMEVPSDQVRIFRSKDRKFTLEFQLLTVSEANSQKTVYLCTTSMSVGLFIEIMNTLGKLDDVDNKNHAAAPHWFEVPANKAADTWLDKGVRSWCIAEGKFALNTDWLDDPGAMMIGKPKYPENAAPPPPAPGDPMQLLSPWSAMYAAQLLGCRLPTSDEWKAAYDLFEAGGGGGVGAGLPKDVWNLRGEGGAGAAGGAGGAGHPSWRTQQDYAKAMELNRLPYPDKGVFIPGKLLFSDIQGAAAKPWTADALAKLAPNRITSSPTPYQNNTLWFLPVDKENLPAPPPNAPKLIMHHLVGNVAQYVFDADTATAVVTSNKPLPAAIDQTLQAAPGKLFVIGGSSLSPPDIPFNERQPVVLTTPAVKSGFCDVGFRLAYTAPKDTIVQVLDRAFKDAKFLPGPRKP